MDDKRLRQILSQMVFEDEGRGDITTKLTPKKQVNATIKTKQEGVIAGIGVVSVLFEVFGLSFENHVADGEEVKKNQILITLSGSSEKILLIERTALNLISYMSGISTLTKKYVEQACNVKIAATRKTHPFFGYFEKKAVEIGGGLSHRMGLDDMYLIKENHLFLEKKISKIIGKAKNDPYHKIEIEVTNLDDCLLALDAGADIIMLDNMNQEKIIKIIKTIEEKGLRNKILLEASGGINLENLNEYVCSGVDIISTSDLTQTKGLDVSLSLN